MALTSVADLQQTPQTDSTWLVSGLEALVKTGQANEDNLVQTLSRPLPSDLRPAGSGINVSASA